MQRLEDHLDIGCSGNTRKVSFITVQFISKWFFIASDLLPSKASGSQPERLINFSKQLAQYDLEGYVSQYTGPLTALGLKH